MTDDMVSFNVHAEAGEARCGTLQINDRSLETPHLFPVVNFYAGGNEGSLFGGGIHRTIKEFMVNHPPVVGEQNYSDLFPGVMTSISSLADYGISEEKLEWYLHNKIREWESFSDYNGVIFADSGGYKILTQGGIQGRDFEKDIDQDKALDIQLALGPDIFVNLDHPIHPDDEFEDRIEKMKQTAVNARLFAERRDEIDGACYLTVHGYYEAMLERSFDLIEEELAEPIPKVFDGVALGSLVPRKDNVEVLVEAVSDCKREMQQRGYEDLPLHVLGISGNAMPLLVALGADSFDSASYLHQAINGKYYVNLFESVPVDEADFDACQCRICNDDFHRARMRDRMEDLYQKDILGSVAAHNLAVQQRELRKFRQLIVDGNEQAVATYLEESVKDQKGFRKFVYKLINERMNPYFEETDTTYA
ncbi:tRNA-guanine transglycosylase [Halobacteria archaeon AArc-curdl1]|uniref:tRNA-guanine transglycosylase n=1 Tax=Natronosalvus hydrolyticus TaxID=2979988 RepID=A0AAP2Z7A0_9EURY|nr:tRNA-guanine transglycosylase [Halobacteria archaeon AArc-curdl1]